MIGAVIVGFHEAHDCRIGVLDAERPIGIKGQQYKRDGPEKYRYYHRLLLPAEKQEA